MTANQDMLKRAAAVAEVRSGMTFGLGTGSTVAFAFDELARRIREKDLRVVGIPTSPRTEVRARQLGIPLSGFEETGRPPDTPARQPLSGSDHHATNQSVPSMRGSPSPPTAVGAYSIEEHFVYGDTRRMAICPRGAEWLWLTPHEAAAIGAFGHRSTAVNHAIRRSSPTSEGSKPRQRGSRNFGGATDAMTDWTRRQREHLVRDPGAIPAAAQTGSLP